MSLGAVLELPNSKMKCHPERSDVSEASSVESKDPLRLNTATGNAGHSHQSPCLVWNPTHHTRARVKTSNWHLLALDIPRPAEKMAMLGTRVFDFSSSFAREPYRKYQESA